ncbi:reticulon-1-A-like isoform X1 [Dendronephthya gigantea]|uniref:reticulon-1-A-like isoform X1 n=1 Tax=Dendronephthya gigantea TaxID=151771 RepID=UPI00106C441E|nr:reticulon-1-A-like isoform X1 [Dendronephthya gigantea]
MEGGDLNVEQQSKLPNDAEIGSSMEKEDTSPSTDLNEPTSTGEDTDENVVSSTSNDDQVDAKRLETEDKSLEEKSALPSSGQLTSRLAVWMINNETDQRVIDLIYWRDIKKTAVVFGITLLVLLFLAYHTVLSVLSFFALSLLTVSLLYRIGMTVIGAVQKTGTGSPYKSLLEKNISISPEKARDIGECVGCKINCAIAKLTKLFLVEDILASLKFGVFLWFLSCVGKWFNAVTLMIIGTILLFSVPKLYEDHQTQVDSFLCKVCKKTDEIVKTVKTKIESRFKKEKSS